MTRIAVDRGAPIEGLQKTARDHRLPFNFPRSLQNFRLPDKRLRRRRGFEEYVAASLRFHGNQLAKHTGSKNQQAFRVNTTDNFTTRSPLWKTPMSYGVIKHHDDFQLKIGRDFTVEMLVTLGDEESLVSHDPQPTTLFPLSSGFARISPSRNGGVVKFIPRAISGVYIYDQCIIANDCVFNDSLGDLELPTNPDSVGSNNSIWDCVALPALSIVYNKAIDAPDAGKSRFEVEWTIFDSATNKYHRFGTAGLLVVPHEAYVVGKTYHIAVTYDSSDFKVRFFIDGALKATSTDVRRGLGANAKWAGEEDFINNIDRPINRDIVLMNECTVRGNYSSTCAFMNRASLTSTLVGDWTDETGGNWSFTLTTGAVVPQAVWYHDRRAAAPAAPPFFKGVTTTYGKEEATLPGLNLAREWFYDAGPKKVFVHTGTAGVGFDPVTLFQEVEIIFDVLGSPNVIPHIAEGSVSSGGNTAEISQPNPWCCSPPRGTALSELRIWHEVRSIANLLTNKLRPLVSPYPANLKGYWRMNDGSGLLLDLAAGRRLTIHHGLSPWVADADLLGGMGINISDGQHLIKTFSSRDSLRYVDDIHTYLDAFLYNHQGITYITDTIIDSHADFTAQIQIRTPHSYQQDIARHNDTTKDLSWPRFDGLDDPTCSVTEYNLAQGPGGRKARTEAHKQTLFSIEGTAVRPVNPTDNAKDLARIPLIQAFLDHTGSIRLEVMQRYHNGIGFGAPALYRLVAGKSVKVSGAYTGATGTHIKRFTDSGAPFTASDDGKMAVLKDTNEEVLQVSRVTFVSTTEVDLEWYWSPTVAPGNDTLDIFNPLDTNTAYTITFRKRTHDRGGLPSAANSTFLDIFVDDVKVISARVARPAFVRHVQNYDIIIGASSVNDQLDWSVTADDILSGAEVVPGRPPWQKIPEQMDHASQHFMTAHQDCPGDFTLGFFRLWAGIGISDELIEESWNVSIESKSHSNHLVFNLELDQMTGNTVPNRCRYPAVFTMGYKGYGTTLNHFLVAISLVDESHIPAGWEMEDNLGYVPQPAAFDNRFSEAKAKMLAPFRSTLRQQGGVLAVFDDFLSFDRDLDGTFSDVFLTAQGTMSDFSPGRFWEGVVIGDRTIMVGDGGLPKVFNGRVCTKAGLARWNGGNIRAQMLTGGKLTKSRWYHLRLVFHDDHDQLQAVSPPIIFRTNETDLSVRLKNIPQHPDPRVTSVRIYATPGHVSEDLALGDTPRLTIIGAVENVTYSGGNSGIVYGDAQSDSDLLPVILALDVISPPMMTTATSYNGRLVGGGNPLVPDAFFWSQAGNPESFLESSFGVLEEGTGDRIVKIISAFGSVFVFKANSVWRLDETQPGSINPWATNKVIDSVGAVSNRAVCVHTDPDTGRSFIFFWSKHGPYIFDGVNLIYIGQPLEEGLDARAFDWVDVEKVALVHDITEREIICLLQLAGKDRNDVGFSFNYRYSNFEQGLFSWSEYTGLLGEVGLTIVTSDDQSIINSPIEAPLPVASLNVTYVDRFLPLFAANNGKIYKWGESDFDGHPDDAGTYSSRFVVSSYASQVVTVTASPSWGSIRGLWATVVKANFSDFFSFPIRNNTVNSFTFDTGYGSIDFDPSVGDFIYLGRPPASAEFPWDMLDIPHKNKQLHRLLLWADKEFYYRWRRDWVTDWEKQFVAIANPEKKRVHVDFAQSPSLEVFKLQLVSFEVDSRIDSYAYIMTPTDAEDLVQ